MVYLVTRFYLQIEITHYPDRPLCIIEWLLRPLGVKAAELWSATGTCELARAIEEAVQKLSFSYNTQLSHKPDNRDVQGKVAFTFTNRQVERI